LMATGRPEAVWTASYTRAVVPDPSEPAIVKSDSFAGSRAIAGQLIRPDIAPDPPDWYSRHARKTPGVFEISRDFPWLCDVARSPICPLRLSSRRFGSKR